MRSFGKKFLTTASITAIASVAFAVVSVAAPGIASARCAGQGNEVRSTLVVDGQEYVAESPDTGSCNGNNTYSAHFAAKVSGLRASVWIQNNGVWTPHYGSGYNMSGNNYSYTDNNSNSLMTLCVDDGIDAICGWGTDWVFGAGYFPVDVAPYGVNYGF